MKRPKAGELDALRRRITSRDPSDVDRLYGLEPVYEPGARPPGVHPEEFVAFRCPYCGERLTTCVEVTAGERTYIEDCEVCCHPIELSVELAPGGALSGVRVRRMDQGGE